MTEFFSLCIIAGVVSAVAASVAHKELKGAVSASVGVLLISVILSPIIGLGDSLLSKIPDPPKFETGEGGEYGEAARGAFEEGIGRAIAEKFSLKEEEVSVFSGGFSFENMRAEKISVVLTGGSVLSDYRGIREYVEENFVFDGGKCEVDFEG